MLLATKDRICDCHHKCRSASPVIHKGENIYHITCRNPTVPGRLVCKACYLWYLQQPTTTARPTAGTVMGSRSNQAASVPPNAVLIRQSVNAGQRGSTMDAPSVVPIPHGPIQYGPRSHSHNQTHGPVIATPGTSSQGPGYSSNHAHYARKREHWPKQLPAQRLWKPFPSQSP
ncbi:hypothetical protein OG21DRAFT_1527136 [Imleria badia]|nr:hypothetical protein OG21DRAFT_1527136 [Imleria badia]